MSQNNTTCLPLYSLGQKKKKTKKAPIVSAALKRAHVFLIFTKTYIHLCSNDPKGLIISLLKKYD